MDIKLDFSFVDILLIKPLLAVSHAVEDAIGSVVPSYHENHGVELAIIAFMLILIVLFGIGFAIDFFIGNQMGWPSYLKLFKWYLPAMYCLGWLGVYFFNL